MMARAVRIEHDLLRALLVLAVFPFALGRVCLRQRCAHFFRFAFWDATWEIFWSAIEGHLVGEPIIKEAS